MDMSFSLEYFYEILRRIFKELKRRICAIPKIYRGLTYKPNIPIAAIEFVPETILDTLKQPEASGFEEPGYEGYALLEVHAQESNELQSFQKNIRANHISFYVMLFLLALVFGVFFISFLVSLYKIVSILTLIYQWMSSRFLNIIEKYVYVQFYDGDEEPEPEPKPQPEPEPEPEGKQAELVDMNEEEEEKKEVEEVGQEVIKEEKVKKEEKKTEGAEKANEQVIKENKKEDVEAEKGKMEEVETEKKKDEEVEADMEKLDATDSSTSNSECGLNVDTCKTIINCPKPSALGPWNEESDEEKAYAVFCRELQSLTFSTPVNPNKEHNKKPVEKVKQQNEPKQQQENDEDRLLNLEDYLNNV